MFIFTQAGANFPQFQGIGNVSECAEFNFHADPEAAHAVLRLTRFFFIADDQLVDSIALSLFTNGGTAMLSSNCMLNRSSERKWKYEAG